MILLNLLFSCHREYRARKMPSPVVFSAEPGKAKWPDVSTACLKDKLKFCFFIFLSRPID